MKTKTFTALFNFCGLGAGARGFLDANAQLGADAARFINMGGIDNDPHSCADFRRLANGPALQADISKLTTRELIAWLTKEHGSIAANRRPDCVFSSPPCKGFSRLLGKKKSLEPKYQALNRLVYQGLFLVCEAWDEPPPMIVMENVPGIETRGEEVLSKVRQMLTRYGYVFHEGVHDCGEVGGLAQHRKRYLMVARRPQVIPGFVYQPPKKRVRACGEVLTELPIPGVSEEGGTLHRLPQLSWLNWVRLALIPPGGDWRDLPSAVTLEQTAKAAGTFKGRPGLFGVQEWQEPAPTVSGSMKVSGGNGTAAVADPMVRLEHEPRRNTLGVGEWDEPAKAVRARSDVRTGEAAIADPRTNSFGNVNRVTGWDQPVGCVVASPAPSSGAPAVADPMVRAYDSGRMGVQEWSEPAKTVTGESYPSNGSASVADPRIALGNKGEPFGTLYDVTGWDEPVGAITGAVKPSSGAAVVADPRPIPPIAVEGAHHGTYGVNGWDEPLGVVAGASRVSNGSFSVADPMTRKKRRSKKEARHSTKYRMEEWDKPAHTVTGGDQRVGSGAPNVADPRDLQRFLETLAPGELTTPVPEGAERRSVFAKFDNRGWDQVARTVAGNGTNGGYAVSDPLERVATNQRANRFSNQYRIGPWDQPANTVTGDTDIQEGAPSVADVRLKRPGRNGFYGVISWQAALGAITGHANIDNGAFAIADPRQPHKGRIPVIISKDDSWHRPLTTLELAALQGLPMMLDGKPLELSGKTVSGWRERIGNAVPVGAGKAIALSVLKALLAGSLGTWFLSMTDEPIWVRKRDGYPDLREVTV